MRHSFIKRIIAWSFYAVVLLLLDACASNSSQTPRNEEIKEADSLVRAYHNVDSLALLAQRFAKAGNKKGELIVYREWGKCCRLQSRFQEATDIHLRGLHLAIEEADTLEIIQALNNIATNFRRMGILDEASSYHYQALAYCDSYSDKQSFAARKNRVVSLNGIGNVHLTMDNREAADSILRLALAGERSLGSLLGQAINYANIGSIFESNQQIDSARFYYEHSMQLNHAAKSELGIALCWVHLGRLCEKQHDLEQAAVDYQKAYTLMQAGSDTWHALEAGLSLARIAIEQHRLGTAARYIEESRGIAEQIHSLEHLAELYRLEYLLHEQKGDSKEALRYFVKSIAYADSVKNDRNMLHMQNVRVRYEQQNKKKEIELIQKNFQNERALQRYLLLILVGGLLLACVVIGFMWYVLRLRAQKQQIRQQMEEMRTSFFTNITHEFRTPLTVIESAASELMRHLPADASNQRQCLTDILRHERNLLKLINQILDIAKISSGHLQIPNPKHGDIVGFVHLVCDSFQSIANEKRIRLCYFPQEERVEMDFIPDSIQKILQNLISNAIKFSPKESEIIVTTRMTEQGKKLQLSVCDQGIGMNAEQKTNAFKPFYQAANDSRNIGTGIGLSLVKLVVEALNGTISLHSAPGEGAEFVVTLPICSARKPSAPFRLSDYQVDELPALDDVQSSFPMEEGEDTGNATRILIVEDTPEVAHYTRIQLNPAYSYYFAANGNEGLKKAEELVPDIVITDIMMPGMDGFELCRKVRGSELLNHIPVIMVTAKVTPEDRLQGLEAGADAYIEKPFRSDELNMRVEKLLEQRALLRQKYASMEEPCENESPENERKSAIDVANEAFLAKVGDAVQEVLLQGKIDYDALAYQLCLSRAQLNRKIKAVTGLTTTEYILQIRMLCAKQLLDTTDCPVWEVAMKCGMENDTYFVTLFKKSTGMTPTQYRNRNA